MVRRLDVETTIDAGITEPSSSSTPATRPPRTTTRRTPTPVRTTAPRASASRTYALGIAIEPPRGYESELSRAILRKQ